MVTAADIEAAKTPKGAWTRETLAAWGVPWPPPSGWKQRLIAGEAVEPAPVIFATDDVEIDAEVAAMARALCEVYGLAPEQLINEPKVPRWLTFVDYATKSLAAAALVAGRASA